MRLSSVTERPLAVRLLVRARAVGAIAEVVHSPIVSV
ncbi:hypothetical protein JOE55_001684 [Kocuria palustris]|nr:hypothetical protein [Kocuria palustris]